MNDFIEKFACPTFQAEQDVLEITRELKAVYNKQIIDSFIEHCENTTIEKTCIYAVFLSKINDSEEAIVIPGHIISLFRRSLKEMELSLTLGAVTSFLIYYQDYFEVHFQWQVEVGTGMSIYAGRDYLEGICKVVSVGGRVMMYNNQCVSVVKEYDIRKKCPDGSGSEILLLTSYPPDLLFEGNGQLGRNHETGSIETTFKNALKILEDKANVYYNWVIAVTDAVVVVEGDSKFIYSGSDINHPGVIDISFPANSTAIAEMLVHESTHQYWFMSQWFEDIVNGCDTDLYYSPVKKCDRPLLAIHTAYHAFSNVVLFYDLCVQAEIQDDGYCLKNLRPLIEQMKVLQKTLESTNGLTTTGDALWKPLADRLNRF